MSAKLARRRFHRFAGLPVLIALSAAAIVALPASPAVAAETPPSPSGPKLVDLGPLGIPGRGVGRVSDINNKGQVAGVVWTDSGPHATILEYGARTDLQGDLPAGATSSEAVGINDAGLVTGRVGGVGKENQSFRWKGGKAELIDPRMARAVNEKGQIAGDAWVLEPDGEILDISAFKNQYTEVAAINKGGVVVGVADTTPEGGLDAPFAFRTVPGQPIDLKRDLLKYVGRTLARDVNDRGQVAGYGTDLNGGYVPLIWDAGTPVAPPAPLGGTAAGINNAGTAVGMIRVPGGQHAAMFENGGTTDLNTLIPADSGWTLTDARAINDRGQIAGVGRPAGAEVDHAFLLDLTPQGPTVESLTLETRSYPSTEWKPVDAGGTIDGNRVRITVRTRNPNDYFLFSKLRLSESVSGKELPGGTRDVVLGPKETVTEQIEWDTAGYAWDEGAKPASDRTVVAQLMTGDTVRDGKSAPILIQPKPAILTHGYKSNAASSWGAYQPILTKGHPLLKGYAVGDGQATGTMNTGSESAPYAGTFTIRQNAQQQAQYIEGVRRKTGAEHVDIVAHSMGGLISRQYIQTEMPASTDEKPVVNRLIQLGTPNMGSPCADTLMDLPMLPVVGLPAIPIPLLPATLQLTPRYVNEVFNTQITDLKGVVVSNMVGHGITVPCFPFPDGDIVVPVKSAQFTYQDIPYTDTMHTEMTESAKDFEDYVKPRLASLSTAEPRQKRSAAAASDADSGSVNSFAAPAAEVSPGATETLNLDVPEGTAFGVTGALPPTVGVTLRKPDGTVAASWAPNSDQAKQPIQSLAVEKHVAGGWTVEVTNTGTEKTRVALAAWVAGNDVKVSAEAEADDAGRVTLTAKVSRPGGTVTAIVTDEKGVGKAVEMTDEKGDGTFRAVTEALADGGYAVTVRAETTAGLRVTHTSVQVQRPDTREFRLEVTPQPGGTVSIDPQQDVYRVGTKVTLTPKAEGPRMPIGWTVNGVAKPAGKLTLTMDRDHEVVAKFGGYSVTELGAAPGSEAKYTYATGLNDKGQISASVTLGESSGPANDQLSRAVRWEGGKFTELPCEDGVSRCNSYGSGINEAGDVVGSSSTTRGDHATVWSKGTVKDLHTAAMQSSDSSGSAINDNGQVVGSATRYNARFSETVVWSNGGFRRPPESPQFMARGNGSINGKGTVPGGYVTASNIVDGPYEWMPAVYENGQMTKLPVPECESEFEHGTADDINHRGDIVGSYDCSSDAEIWDHAYLWKDGERTDLGAGAAKLINNSGMVAGLSVVGKEYKPALWLDGTRYQLSDLLSRPICAGPLADGPCITVEQIVDMNSSGEIVVQGETREGRINGQRVSEHRSFLLRPTSESADLRVSQAVSSLTPAPGQPVTWTTTVTNLGPGAATGVRADVTVPSRAPIQDCETTRGACKKTGDVARTTISTLPAGATATITVTGRVDAKLAENEQLTSSATVLSLAVPDPEHANNTASTTSVVHNVLDRKEIAFADPVRVNASSYEVPVTLTNRLSTPMKLLAIGTTGPFRQTNSCPVELQPGEKCAIQVSFAPTEIGPATGQLRISTEEGAPPTFTVSLSGRGIESNHPPVPKDPEEWQQGVVGKPIVVEIPFTDGDTGDTHTVVADWADGGKGQTELIQKSGGGTIRVSRTFEEAGEYSVFLTLKDSKGDTAYTSIGYLIAPGGADAAPEIAAGPDAELTAGERFQRTVTFTDPTSTSWKATVDHGDGTVRSLDLDAQELALDHTWAKPGAYPVTITVTDDGGLSATARFTVTVTPAQTPNTAPAVEFSGPASLTEGGTWIAKGTVVDPDADTWSVTADFGDGSGPQPVRLDGKSFDLSHVFTDDGARTVEVRVTDDKGGNAAGTRQVKVANAAPAVTLTAPAAGAVVAVGGTVRLEAAFTDAGVADTHTATWEIGGKTYDSGLAGSGGSGVVSLPHVFTKAGRYPVSVTVSDDDGGRGTAGKIGEQKAYVLVHDPASAIVGAGVTASPKGSCTLGAFCGQASAATFALHAAYPRKATAPVGELRWTAAGFDLRSSSFTVLAAADGTAVLRGAGRANGSDVTFEVTATDSGRPLDRTDSVRLVVTSRTGQVIYDNERDGTPNPVLGVVRISD
ncbi:PKD domain-containing protein [Actinoplanes sp. DH11]|uniref:PKD domain-containing protein n=1 Tax=Actinoplanes sp. DH11 TaxID=2857011 RepID=UPI001E30CB80|nr:PKD domain-containing protein [Actinoplanes sp. DH11]